ncbi:MAG: Cna B-type domain-containing protein, partial [Methanobrevibacter sp.]|uniref:Cna B-type domain-containing protein n=1 Tax=Methanobrevibacter sp. TaxID=66852 RepID=UPI0025E51339
MSDASPIRETSNTLAVDSIDEASYNSLGTDSEEDEIEIDYNNETNLLRSSNDVEIYNDDNIICAENGKNILGASNDLEIDNNSLIVLGAGNDLEILGASNDVKIYNDDNIIGAENDLEILGASNDEPVLGANIDVWNQYGHSTQDVMNAIQNARPGDVLYLGGHTYSGSGTITAGRNQHPTIQNIRIVGGSYDGDPQMASVGSMTFTGTQTQDGHYTISSGYNFVDVTFENLRAPNGRMFSFNSGSLTNVVFNNLESREHLFFIYGCHESNSDDQGNPVVLTNCNFTNCKQTYTGGGNHQMDDGSGQLGVLFGAKLVGCNFINTSSANHGGAFCISDEYQGGGGRVASSLTNCNFINVTSRWFAVYIHGNYTGESSHQGDSYITESQVLDNCKFINCTSSGEYGGALGISHNDVIIRNCEFTNNTGGEGAAIMVGGILYKHDAFWGYNIEGNNMTIENCTFTNNHARIDGQTGTYTDAGPDPSEPTGNAGAVFVYGNNTKIINTVFENNTAANNGAAMYIHGSGTIVENSTLTGNSAVNGTVYIEGSNTKITNSNFFNNTAENGAGAYVEGANTQITDSEASYNTAVCNGDPEHSGLGAGFHIIGDNAVFSNITSKNNTADSEGGSIYVVGERTLVEDSLFAYNTAPVGGAMSIDGSDAKFFNNTIINNTAVPNEVRDTDNSGGAIYISGDRTNFTSNNISNNFAKDNGGALYVDGTNTYFDDIYADNNNALNGGFAQLLGANNLIVQNSTFTNNHATGDSLEDNIGEGGAFHISDSQNANIQGYFVNNTAINGSAIYVENSSLHIEDSDFFDNQAATHMLDIYPPDKTKFEPGDEMIITISHIGGDNIANAIHDHARSSNITVNNISYLFYHNGTEYIKTTPDHDVVPVYGWENSNDGEDLYEDDKENNQVIYYTVRNTLTGEILNESFIRTDIDGTIKLNLTGLAVGFYEVIGTYLETPYYTAAYNFTALFGVEGLNLTINKTVNETPVYVNESVVFTINVTNNGPFNATDVIVKDVVPSQFRVTGSNDTAYNRDSGILVIDHLNVGDSYLFTITAVALFVGNWTNVANATCNENDTVVEDDAIVEVLSLKNITVKKVWDDNNNQDGVRPLNVTVVLLADTVEYKRTVLNESNNWTFTFTNLPVRRDGKNITYDIEEIEVENYTVIITRDNYYFVINNTHETELVNVTVLKVWDDNDNQDGFRPPSVNILLFANGNNTKNATLDESNNWTFTFY